LTGISVAVYPADIPVNIQKSKADFSAPKPKRYRIEAVDPGLLF